VWAEQTANGKCLTDFGALWMNAWAVKAKLRQKFALRRAKKVLSKDLLSQE
jgi:hypothetical protein